jgi:hypothetical protein
MYTGIQAYRQTERQANMQFKGGGDGKRNQTVFIYRALNTIACKYNMKDRERKNINMMVYKDRIQIERERQK